MNNMTTRPQSISVSSPELLLRRIDLRTITGATLAVLLLRFIYLLWALPISAAFPYTQLEQQVSLAPGSAPLGLWLQRAFVMPWMRYDYGWYHQILRDGYRAGDGTAAFHPLYPMLAWPLAQLSGNVELALLLVSTIAAIALTVIFTRYVALVHAESLSNTAGWLLLLTPPAFVLLAPYNESLFLTLAVACFWTLHQRRWWFAGLLGGLAALTRQQGLALMLPIVYAIWKTMRAERLALSGDAPRSVQPLTFLAVLLVPLGYALFIGYRTIALGELEAVLQARGPAEFLRRFLVSGASEQVLTGQRVALPWEAVIGQIRQIMLQPAPYDLVIDLVLGIITVAAISLGFRLMTIPERLYTLGIVAVTLCYYNGERAPLLSMPRHLMLVFPLYIVLARWVGTGRRQRLAIVALLVFNLFLAGAYVRNGWIP